MSGGWVGTANRLPGARAGVILLILTAGSGAAAYLRLELRDLLPTEAGLSLMREFFAAALTPAVRYQAEGVPPGTMPLLIKVLSAAVATVRFAVAAVTLSMLIGIPLGTFASESFWRATAEEGRANARIRRAVSRALYLAARVAIAILRSVHELLWAVLLLAALGFTPMAAVVAIGVPYGAMLAKIFSEILDEAPQGASRALRAGGAGRLQIFCFGLVPLALADLVAYALYRFECAVRSSAVLGFFGFPTLGYYLVAAFENLHYGEVWTYLYALFGVVLFFDWWSGRLRRSLAT